MLKVGIVGIGAISNSHIPSWMSVEEAKIVALCDIRPEQMKKWEGKLDANFYTDCDEMLANEELDVLDVCLPTYLHTEYAMKGFSHNLHVMCEKPISLNIDDIDMLYDEAEKRGKTYMIGQVVRFWQEYDYLKKVYESGELGKLMSGKMSRLSGVPKWSWDGWLTDKKRSGLVPFDLHIHDADFMVYAFGAPKNAIVHRANDKMQDYFNVTYEYDGFFINAEAAWYNGRKPFAATFIFQFEKGVIEFTDGKLTVYKEENDEIIVPFDADTNGDVEILGLPQNCGPMNEIRYFASCALAGKPADKIKREELKTVLNLLNNIGK